MGHYGCIYYKKIGKKLYVNNNQACWAGIVNKNYWKTQRQRKLKKNGIIPANIYIFIDSQYYINNQVENTVKIINKITPCSIVNINNTNYVKYKLTFNKHYDGNLLLLNFIRNLWYTRNLNVLQYHKDISKYSNEDPLLFLTTCLRDNVKDNGSYYGDHCNIIKNVVPKTLKYLKLKIKKNSLWNTNNFLIQKIK